MSTIKAVLRQKPNKDGTLPLCLRITKDRKTSFIHLGYALKPGDWDSRAQRVKRSFPNHVRLNNFLIKKLSEATDSTLELETNKAHVNAKLVKNKIKPSSGQTFFAQADAYLEKLKQAGKYNQYTSDKPRVKHFKEFIGHDIAFQDITPVMLERFKAYIKSTRNLSERSAVNAIVMVRSVFSHAIKDNMIDAKYYPFGKGKMKIKFPDSVKVGLSSEEVKKLEDVALPDPTHNHARNLWLTSFYFAGMRVSDVFRLRWSDLQNDRLHYSMGKNNKGGSLKIPAKALAILEQYKQFRENKDDLIFPDLKGCDFDNAFKTQRTIAFRTSATDKCLRLHVAPEAGIDKKLTMHIARHTFGNISGDKIPIQMLQKLYRHSSITTTIGYQQNFIHKDADDALEAVLNLS
ncbi:MAG: site-specific integrase [Bacteroidetes bacterium]|nr:site-specific integrase [Bacteroidota bacterium]